MADELPALIVPIDGDISGFQKSMGGLKEAMGAVGIRVAKPGELRSAFDQAFSCGKPAVIDVQTDINALAPMAWKG